ncbi:MAG: type II toxin-antitoxin system VapC family toxin [Candidatus Margulisbacteria bacterium]|jgi:tRNA(fMet)-specific endonuclease VapC|nr:type II toxin-antitoxin system VapC family toxin [Candidatus Margulisiibacteriota bacterium]
MKIYLLDTDICSYIIKENPPSVAKKLVAHQDDDICISAITYAELLYGARRRKSRQITHKINLFVELVRVIECGRAVVEQYADIRQDLETRGKPLADFDILIAATARSLNAVLVTNNQKHFARISGLKLENWQIDA